MEYTQNYQLPLWDKEDAVKRTDFNESNQKIDEALETLSCAIEGQIVTGTYTGQVTGSSTVTQTITLGFQPRFLFVRDTNYKGVTYSGDTGWGTQNLGFATPEHGHYISGQYRVLRITADGFVAGGTNAAFNTQSTVYTYLAIR